jgi:hypothetical protein
LLTINPYPVTPPNQWNFGLSPVPGASPQILVGQTTTLIKLYVSNTSNAPVTLTVYDNSTNGPGGTPCQIFPAVSIPANAVDVVDLGGVIANGGVSWQASVDGVLHAWLRGAF